jgi:putative chitinase
MTAELLRNAIQKASPRADKRFLASINDDCWNEIVKRGMADKLVLARFLAQCHHESGGFTKFEESGNYRAETIVKVWPRRFPTIESAHPYAHRPVQLFSNVYANRMGNRGPETNDGWTYRGGGIEMHTGKAQYDKILKATGFTQSEIQNPSNALANFAAASSFWESNGVIAHARAGNDQAVTKKINGGLIGFDDRKKLTQRYTAILENQPPLRGQATRQEVVAKRERQGTAAQASAVVPAAGGASVAGNAESNAVMICIVSLIFVGAALGLAVWLKARASKLNLTLMQERANSYEAA